jgi:hypothetical protein
MRDLLRRGSSLKDFCTTKDPLSGSSTVIHSFPFDNVFYKITEDCGQSGWVVWGLYKDGKELYILQICRGTRPVMIDCSSGVSSCRVKKICRLLSDFFHLL